MRTIQVCTVGAYEWVGDDLLSMANPNSGIYSDRFEYSATAVNKVTAYSINYADLFKIP